MGGHGNRAAEGVGAIAGEPVTKGKEWPTNGQVLSRRLNRSKSALRPAGIEITHGEGRNRQIITISANPRTGAIFRHIRHIRHHRRDLLPGALPVVTESVTESVTRKRLLVTGVTQMTQFRAPCRATGRKYPPNRPASRPRAMRTGGAVMASRRYKYRHRSLPAPGEVRTVLDGYAALTGARSAHTTGATAHADLCALPAVARLWEAATRADMTPARVYLSRRGCWPGRHVRVPLPAQSVRWLAREAAGWHGLPPGAVGAVVFAWRPSGRASTNPGPVALTLVALDARGFPVPELDRQSGRSASAAPCSGPGTGATWAR